MERPITPNDPDWTVSPGFAAWCRERTILWTTNLELHTSTDTPVPDTLESPVPPTAWTDGEDTIWTTANTWPVDDNPPTADPPASPVPSAGSSLTPPPNSPLDQLPFILELRRPLAEYRRHSLHVPKLRGVIRSTFYFDIDGGRHFVDQFNRIFKAEPPLEFDWPIVTHPKRGKRKEVKHATTLRGDPYCTCSCCHHECPTHSL